jgi:GNAT superfamily N-acetyltransferase
VSGKASRRDVDNHLRFIINLANIIVIINMEEIMKSIILRPSDPERDFGPIAALISSQEDELTSEMDLKKDYEKNLGQVIGIVTAVNEQGDFQGFYWAFRNRLETGWAKFYLVVTPEVRRQGVGNKLYKDLLQAVEKGRVINLRVSVSDTCPEYREFAERRGFSEQRHHFGMKLDLDGFDDQPYDNILARLKREGFQFTSMEELGNTEDTQKKLYELNNSAALSTPGAEGERSWDSFEDFQKSVCQSDWYKPAGQIVAIEPSTGGWAAMSAITRMPGTEYAYNLFTGVDQGYRGRKLGQAVKVLALRYARDVLKVDQVRTHHNTKNLPMIAIDRKLGYTVMPGTFLMEKILE